MVMFVILIAIMSISMGVAVQTAEFQMRREREAELIFRGEQFVEAIRMFKLKYGRYPMQLKEIYEADPRVIRKRWKDPITDSENWGIIFLGQEGRPGQQGRLGFGGQGAVGGAGAAGAPNPIGTQTPFGSEQGLSQDRTGETGEQGAAGSGSTATGQSADRMMGPIVGVHSTSCEESIKIYEGHTTYCEWRFIYREQQQQQRGGAVRPGQRPGGQQPSDPRDKLPFGVPPGGAGPNRPGSGSPGSGGTGGANPPGPIRTPRP